VVPVAASPTLLGQTLPSDWLGWFILLVSIWSGLSVFQIAVAAFIDQHRRRPITLRLSGYVLPCGWIAWGGLLIYGVPRPISVLLALVGLLAMLVSATLLRRDLS